jgi:hypothetical protein
VDRLRIVDTTGCALPVAITYIIEQIREVAPTLPLEIHCHNDFGFACANIRWRASWRASIAGLETSSGETIGGIGPGEAIVLKGRIEFRVRCLSRHIALRVISRGRYWVYGMSQKGLAQKSTV